MNEIVKDEKALATPQESETGPSELVQKLTRLSEAVRDSGRYARAFYQFTDSVVFNTPVSPTLAIRDYDPLLGFDLASSNNRVVLLEEIIRPQDRFLFTIPPTEIIEAFLQKGGVLIGGGQVFAKDTENPKRHTEAAYVEKSRLMLCLPVSIPRAQYLFAADVEGDVLHIVEHLEFSRRCEGRD